MGSHQPSKIKVDIYHIPGQKQHLGKIECEIEDGSRSGHDTSLSSSNHGTLRFHIDNGDDYHDLTNDLKGKTMARDFELVYVKPFLF